MVINDELRSLVNSAVDHADDRALLRDEVLGPLLRQRDEARAEVKRLREQLDPESIQHWDTMLAARDAARTELQEYKEAIAAVAQCMKRLDGVFRAVRVELDHMGDFDGYDR
jgi:hypothetical protein